MNLRTVGYWMTTGIVGAGFLAAGATYLTQASSVAEALRALGYPAYLMTLLGILKLLGAAVLLAPGLPRLKEWAYAGILFNLAGAVFSHLASGVPGVAAPAGLMGVVALSYALRPAERRTPVARRIDPAGMRAASA